LESEPVDVDGQPIDLRLECSADGVSNGRIDLPRDLGHGNTERDGQVELDRQAATDPGRRNVDWKRNGGTVKIVIVGRFMVELDTDAELA
jgi:hypothetical protein